MRRSLDGGSKRLEADVSVRESSQSVGQGDGKRGWIGVDLDGTLAFYERWDGSIGLPVPEMLEQVKRWLDADIEVRIFTARAAEWEPIKNNKIWPGQYTGEYPYYMVPCPRTIEIYERDVKPIEDWCERHIGVRLQVTCMKDPKMVELWDDRAVQVVPNMGQRVDALAATPAQAPIPTPSEPNKETTKLPANQSDAESGAGTDKEGGE